MNPVEAVLIAKRVRESGFVPANAAEIIVGLLAVIDDASERKDRLVLDCRANKAEADTFRSLLQQMLNVAENCDETGYVDGFGFVDIDKLHGEVRDALTPTINPLSKKEVDDLNGEMNR